LADWQKRGLVNTQTTMAVNVSPRQLKEADLLPFLLSVLQTAGVSPSSFVLEITESVLVEDSPKLLDLLRSIVAAGIALDLDDFGTGYSSLSYLHRFPFRSVKIDRSFISRMTTDPESVTMVASIVALVTSLKLSVIAEGVETEVRARHLSKMGCAAAQGYLFSPARPAKELEPHLVEGARVREMRGRAEPFARPVPRPIPAAVPTSHASRPAPSLGPASLQSSTPHLPAATPPAA